MAKVLVTGVAGFIPSHLCERLLERGDSIIGIDNFDPFYGRDIKERNLSYFREHQNFTFVEADLRDAKGIKEIVESSRPDSVVHLAAKAGVRPSIIAPDEYIDVNISGTLNLLRACSGLSIDHFVFASSSSVYGSNTKVPFSEDDRTDRPESPYAMTKKAGEGLCYTYHRLTGIPITCLRFFTVYGPRQRPDLAIHKFTQLIMAGKSIPFYGDGQTSRDYTYVDDTVRGIISSLDTPDGYNIYNLGNSRPITLLEMVNTIGEACNRPIYLDHLPHQPGDVPTTFADITKAKKSIGYDPNTPFEEGVTKFVSWFNSMRIR
jgi:UDP-glucuronate 4-epimerase